MRHFLLLLRLHTDMQCNSHQYSYSNRHSRIDKSHDHIKYMAKVLLPLLFLPEVAVLGTIACILIKENMASSACQDCLTKNHKNNKNLTSCKLSSFLGSISVPAKSLILVDLHVCKTISKHNLIFKLTLENTYGIFFKIPRF